METIKPILNVFQMLFKFIQQYKINNRPLEKSAKRFTEAFAKHDISIPQMKHLLLKESLIDGKVDIQDVSDLSKQLSEEVLAWIERFLWINAAWINNKEGSPHKISDFSSCPSKDTLMALGSELSKLMEDTPEHERRVVVYMASTISAPDSPDGIATVVYEEVFLRKGIKWHEGYSKEEKRRHLILANEYPIYEPKWLARFVGLLKLIDSLDIQIVGIPATEPSLRLVQEGKYFISDIKCCSNPSKGSVFNLPEDLVSGHNYKEQQWWRDMNTRVKIEFGDMHEYTLD